ncbi:hypothetical protein B0T20DRAFT_500419 [Sordaria brevicollis]|uniref:Uncharacterized protein n=1 Tax=Sordaria brevicollis TaxID=83679 RepID=A0AAE0UAS9_SORBR|nr:hypothetical protein B0T20DRAFT_500419 [Sordaria brevicollis]
MAPSYLALLTFLSLFSLFFPSLILASPLSLFNRTLSHPQHQVHPRDRPHIDDPHYASFSESCDAHAFDPATCVFSAHCVKKADDGNSRNDTADGIITSGEDKGRRSSSLDLNKCISYYVRKGEEGKADAQTEMDWKGVKLETRIEVQRPFGSMCRDFSCEAVHFNAPHLIPLVYCDRGVDKPRLVLDLGISNNDGYLECFGQRGV